MIQERGFTENQTRLSALPFVVGIASNFSGGFARDAAVRRFGPASGPRLIGALGLGTAAVASLAALVSQSNYAALAWLTLSYAGITFQQPSVFSTCIDIGGRRSGAVAGYINTAGALGGLLSSIVFGYLIERFHGYAAVLESMCVVLALSAVLWLFVDATETLAGAQRPADQPFPPI